MRLRASITGRREQGPKGTGFMWVYYMAIRDQTGRVIASDNTGSWRVIYDQSLEDMRVIGKATTIGMVKP